LPPTNSIGHPFLGDYVRLRQNPQWKKVCLETNDQYVVFADIINKITRSGGKASRDQWAILNFTPGPPGDTFVP
jgi:hypothetical protein